MRLRLLPIAVVWTILVPVCSPVLASTVSAATLNEVPVTVCPTGTGGPASGFPPETVSLPVTPKQSYELAAYSGKTGVPIVIAPTGWHCEASLGADGDALLSVAPPHKPVIFAGGTRRSAEGVSVEALGPCYGCVLAAACPFFAQARAAAKQSYHAAPGSALCPIAPGGEHRVRLSSSTVDFEDPPYVLGDGSPSGGPNPANGVVRFALHPDPATTVATCTLPQSEHWICAVSLNFALQRDWNG